MANEKITPFLWFDGKAEEAAKFYVKTFKSSKIESVTRYGAAGPGRKGSVMSVVFRLEGQRFNALNGGPQYHFTPAISFMVSCKTQAEIDDLWGRLSKGGKPNRCGWLTDKYGLSWQIIPSNLGQLIEDPRGMAAMLEMDKLDIKRLKQAVAGPR